MTLVAPTDIAVANVSSDNADLSWTDNSSANNGYEVHTSTDGGSSWTLQADLADTATSYSLTGLADGEKYTVVIVAYDGSNRVADGVVISADGSVESITSPNTITYTQKIRGSLQIQ